MAPRQSSGPGRWLRARRGQHPHHRGGQRGWGPSRPLPAATRPPSAPHPVAVVTPSPPVPVTHPRDTLTQRSRWFPAIAANGSHLGNGSGDAARRATACRERGATRRPATLAPAGPQRAVPQGAANTSTRGTGSTRHPTPPGHWHPALSLAGLSPRTPGPRPGRALLRAPQQWGGHLPPWPWGVHRASSVLGVLGHTGAAGQAVRREARQQSWGHAAGAGMRLRRGTGMTTAGSSRQRRHPRRSCPGTPATHGPAPPRGSSTYLLDLGPVLLRRQPVHHPRDGEEAAEETRRKGPLRERSWGPMLRDAWS